MIECDGAQSMSCWSSRTSCKPHTTAHYVSGSRVRTSAATHERVQWTFTQGDRIKHNAERRMPQETRRNTPGLRRPLTCACRGTTPSEQHNVVVDGLGVVVVLCCFHKNCEGRPLTGQQTQVRHDVELCDHVVCCRSPSFVDRHLLSFVVCCRSSFVVVRRSSSFVICCRSSFVVVRHSFVVRRSSFLCRSLFVVRRFAVRCFVVSSLCWQSDNDDERRGWWLVVRCSVCWQRVAVSE